MHNGSERLAIIVQTGTHSASHSARVVLRGRILPQTKFPNLNEMYVRRHRLLAEANAVY